MSGENVELVRSIYADWERGDFSSAEWADPAVEFVSFDGSEPDVRTGPASMSATWGSSLAAWAACLFHVRDGKVTRLVCYWDAERALADPSLAQETGSGEA